MPATGTDGADNAVWTPESERSIFFAFFGLGVFFILVLKEWLGGQFLATAVPCCLMFGYAFLAWDFAEQRPRSDTAGDNLYYLGFLYTLTSLGHSLYRFSVEAENAAAIVTNFGIAIATTILGMMLRVLLGRPGADDPASIEASARLDLAASARELRNEIDYTVREFGDLRKKFKADTEKIVAEALSGVENTLGRVSNVPGVIEQFEKDMREVTGAFSHQARALGQRTEDLKRFGTAVAELRDRISTTIGSLREHSDALDAGACGLSDALRAQAARIGEADFRQALVDQAGAAVAAEIGAATDKFSMLIDQLRDADDRRQQALDASRKATTELRGALDESKRLAAASTDAAAAARDVMAKFELAGAKMSGFNDSVQEVAREIGEASRGVVSRMESAGEQISRFTKALAEWNRKIEEAPRPEGGRPRRRCWFAPWKRARRTDGSVPSLLPNSRSETED